MTSGTDPMLLEPENVQTFLPPNVRRAFDDTQVPLLSMRSAARVALSLSGPLVEVSWPGATAFLGCLRAVRRAGAALAVVVPDIFSVEAPGARQRIARALVDLAEEVEHHRPLFLVRRLRGHSAGEPASRERLLAAIAAEVDAGFPTIALRPTELALPDLTLLPGLLSPFRDDGVAFELEFETGDPVGLTLAALEEFEGAFAAIRGASNDDDVGRAIFITDPATYRASPRAGCRVCLDGVIFKALAQVVDPTARQQLLSSARRDGSAAALAGALDLLAELDDDERAHLEASTTSLVTAALGILSAGNVGVELAIALSRAAARND